MNKILDTASVKPNIVIIYTDQQRYDTLGINGNSVIRTPNIDKLGREGVVFSNCFVSSPLCVPSRTALFTGRYNHSNLSYNNTNLMAAEELNLLDILKQNGYKLGLSGKDHCFGKERKGSFDFFQQFGHFGTQSTDNPKDKEVFNYKKKKMGVRFEISPFSPEADTSSRIVDFAEEFVDESEGQPFFLWMSFPEPHPPYVAPEPYASMYDAADIPAPAWVEGEMANKPYRQQKLVEMDQYGRQYPEPDDIFKLRRIYYANITYIDSQIGRFVQYLKQKGLYENTLLIFTSDHGDYMGDHRMIRKSTTLYDSLTHVSLIFHWTGKFKNTVTDAMVSNIDILPTIINMLELKLPEKVQGESFAGVLYGSSDKHRNMVFMEHGEPAGSSQSDDISPITRQVEITSKKDLTALGMTKGVRTGKWKFCTNEGDVDELYDLVNDPHELKNLSDKPEYKSIVDELRQNIQNWLDQTDNRLSSV